MANARKVSINDEEYPYRLKTILDRPDFLWIHGSGSLNPTKAVAIVGTRSPFYKAMEISQTTARIAGELGYTIVSGYATGIDTFAHIGAMDTEAPTIAVLGAGILQKEPCKPGLERYILSNGIFVSELDDVNAERAYTHLMARDRITSGLADIVIVVETEAAGGAVHTAGLAFQQGRQVYAVVWSENKKYRELAQYLGSDALVQAGIAQSLPIFDAGKDFEQQVHAILETGS